MARIERKVTFRFRPDRGAPYANVRGEMRDFKLPIELRMIDDGLYEATTSLEPGTYSYKFWLPGDIWCLDPLNPRTRSQEGNRNSLLVVDGTDEPVLHAPAPPWVHIEDDGLLAIRAGIRRGEGESCTVRWNEGHGWHNRTMRPVVWEDEHLLFEAHIPVSASTVDYHFLTADGRSVGAAGGPGLSLRLSIDDLRVPIPEWWKDAVVYTVFVDRFRRSGHSGTWDIEDGEALGEARAGGDLEGIIEALPYLEDLGVNTLHLTPLSVAPSAHRYDAIDPRTADEALGGEQALLRLLDAAHERHLKILMDLAVTHVHMNFQPFQDVADRGFTSPYWDWFLITHHPFSEGVRNPGYQHYQKGQWREPLLNLETPEVGDYIVETFEGWARLGVDGFRIDAAAELPPALMRRIRESLRTIDPEIVVFGEVIPEHIYRYLSHGLDAATDFASQELLYNWLWRGNGAGAGDAERGYSRRRFSRGGPGYRAIAFTATHDQHRLLSLMGDSRKARLAYLLVMLRPETPALYYGDEIGLRARVADRQFEGAWPDRQPMIWQSEAWDKETLTLVKAAIAARRSSKALTRGEALPLQAIEDDHTLSFRRVWGGEVVDVVLHAGSTPVTLELPPGAPSGAEVLVSLGEVEVNAEEGLVSLGPWSGVAISRVQPEERVEAFADLVASNHALAALSFKQGSTQVVSLPAHLYLTITEACNLRCLHCLNHSPKLTREKRARHMRSWVLDALAEPLAAARYVGFSHGGESLTSPFLFEALSAIGRARHGRPGRTDIHLLSNGMLLTADAVSRLLDHGVTSLAVSIDGATPETNDTLRLGSHLDTVIEHVRRALAVRDQRGADLRVGLSTVVTSLNVEELPALGRLALELGVDWLKIEELVPATAQAKEAMLRPGDARLSEGLDAIRELLEPSGVVLVDHLVDLGECRCQARRSPQALAFRDADDFANRARFNPCRMAWEQACIDPDGTVHPVDYHHPPLGNLLDRSFFDLWNGDIARRVRRDALTRTPIALREQCTEGLER